MDDRETLRLMVCNALREDIGPGDVTAALIAPHTRAHAQVIAREHAVLCGTAWVDEVFAQLDGRVVITWQVQDGEAVAPDSVLCRLHGPARAILSGERSALNFLQTLSATATITQRYVEAVAGTACRILDTRKTLPLWRAAQKYAVRCGGGHNHRYGLYDALLIKENHILAAGSIAAAVQVARQWHADLPLEVEVETLDELHEALAAGVTRILLDNFSLDLLHAAVNLARGRAQLEASGGINLENVRAYAQTGVDFISVGALTKHIRAIDLSLRLLDHAPP